MLSRGSPQSHNYESVLSFQPLAIPHLPRADRQTISVRPRTGPAIRKLLGRLRGADARGEANLSVRIDDDVMTGQGTSRDVLEASAIAWLDVANQVLRSHKLQPPVAASA